MGAQSIPPSNGLMAEINITPFTDVLLVLLIIFMILAALTTPPGFQKELNNCGCSNPIRVTKLQNIEVGVSATGAMTIDGLQVAPSRLYERMAEAVHFHTGRAGYSTHIALAADNSAPYGSIIKVLDAAREAGDDDVGLVTE